MVNFKAGAGMGNFCFPQEMFPTTEGYTGIHDVPKLRVLVLEWDRIRFVLAQAELVGLSGCIDACRTMVAGLTGAALENIWICACHVLETPHMPDRTALKSERELQIADLMWKVYERVFAEACEEAVESLRPAVFGAGYAYSEANVSRILNTAEGWWHGSDDSGFVDHRIPIYRFDGSDGSPIALLYNFQAQPSVMDGSRLADGGRLITADIAGSASTYIEERIPGVRAFYLTGAGGDQAPYVQAVRTVLDRGNQIRRVDIHENGYQLVELLGERIGQSVVGAAGVLTCSELEGPVIRRQRNFLYQGQVIPPTREIRPGRAYTYLPGEPVETPVEYLRIGGAGLIGIRPEICARTLAEIRQCVGLEVLGLVSFVNGGQKCMPDLTCYDNCAYQAKNSMFAAGTAEQFAKDIVNMIREQE